MKLEGTLASTTKLNYISLWPAASGGASLIAGVGMLAQWKAPFVFFHWAFQIRIFKSSFQILSNKFVLKPWDL